MSCPTPGCWLTEYDKKLIRGVDDPQFAKLQPGSIQIIDVKGDPAKFGVFK